MFMDLENAYDSVRGKDLRFCTRKEKRTEKHVSVIHDMHEGSQTTVRYAVGLTKMVKREGWTTLGIGIELISLCNSDG